MLLFCFKLSVSYLKLIISHFTTLSLLFSHYQSLNVSFSLLVSQSHSTFLSWIFFSLRFFYSTFLSSPYKTFASSCCLLSTTLPFYFSCFTLSLHSTFPWEGKDPSLSPASFPEWCKFKYWDTKPKLLRKSKGKGCLAQIIGFASLFFQQYLLPPSFIPFYPSVLLLFFNIFNA